MLCETCNSIFQNTEWGDHHADAKAFVDAAADGCFICAPLLQYCLMRTGSITDCMAAPMKYRIYSRDDGSYHIIIDMELQIDGVVSRQCKVFVAIPGSTLATDFTIRDRNSTPLFEQAVQIAKGWHLDCLNHHESCYNNLKPTSYPTRLLDLAGPEVRLITCSEEKLTEPYATLSYSWGRDPSFLRLMESNLSDLCKGIPISTLPRVFIEAINFARALSIRYLWIDSLCILQSNESVTRDWMEQSTKMQEVYSNSLLTLSAARAEDPTGSCFGSRDAHMTMPFQIEKHGLTVDSEKYTVCSIRHFTEGLYDQPLGKRAWASQERILSRRVLSFGQCELFWDCDSLPNTCESYPQGFPSTYTLVYVERKSVPISTDPDVLYMTWLDILEEYTDRFLTFPKWDKLVALSAIAAQMSAAMEDIYIAGHFWKTLPQSLNWKIRPEFHGRRNHDIERMEPLSKSHKTPTWSWASMNGPIFNYRGHVRTTLATLDTYTLQLLNEENPKGQVGSSSLTITAYFTPIEWDGRSIRVIGQEKSNMWSIQSDFDEEKYEPHAEANYAIIPLVEYHSRLGGFWEGLILQQVDLGEGREGYERTGHFRLHDSKHLQEIHSLSGICDCDLQFPPENLRTVFGKEKRTIILV